MLDTLVLDSLLILILLLLIPIGMYRGGLREVCSAAGLLLGLLVSQMWATGWGDWLADITGIDVGVSRFFVAVATIVLFAGLIGYGSAASFTYSPGPGGRLYGGLISLCIGVIFLGALIQYVATHLYDDVYPDMIREGYVSRALSIGFDWVLLTVAGVVLFATFFGMFARERDIDEHVLDVSRATALPRRASLVPSMAPEPVNLEPTVASVPDPDAVATTAAVKIREVRHWEEPTPPTMQDLQSGWSRTWPGSVTSDKGKPSRAPGWSRAPQPAREARGPADEQVIRDWLAEDQKSHPFRSPRGSPREDE